jgi:four helix bundle protein
MSVLLFSFFGTTDIPVCRIIAKGSAGELRTQLYLANDLRYIEDDIFNDLLKKCEEI